jgi:hypothetical protein
MIKGGDIPNELVDVALEVKREEKIDVEVITRAWDFTRFIVPQTVVNPKITDEDVDDLPIQDVEMLAGFAMRRIDMDAVGHHLGGLEKVASFRNARGLVDLSSILDGDA